MLSSQRDLIPSFELDDEVYQCLCVDRKLLTASAYDDEVLRGGKWQMSPKPKGMSGGAVLDIRGLSADLGVPSREAPDAKLVSIITEWRPPDGKKPPALIGCRVGYYLYLIRQFLPGLAFVSSGHA
jgi:hypothetical protein